ncbi:uncharacterized protein [Nicotiana sylvestris]|uniref:uncharacterized protein n=1 Tax=Nicotiana sylvestris TaxID=4096 RepID=UPI00388C6FC6
MSENHLQEHEAKERMLSIASKGTLVGGYEVVFEPQGGRSGVDLKGRELVPVETLAPDSTTSELVKGPDPSAQEEPSTSTCDKTPSSPQEPQVSTDPSPSPHFYAEPLTIVVPEMRSLFEEEKEDSEEEDYDNVALASFISTRSRKEPPQGAASKRPITRLRKKEELESVLRKSKKRKISPRGSHLSEKELRKVEDEKSGEREDEKMVKESCEKMAEESAEKISRKSAKKGKSVRKSMKRKVDASEEPGSSKKTKIGDTQDAVKKKLKKTKTKGDVGPYIRKLKARNVILKGQLSQVQEAPSSSSSLIRTNYTFIK